MSIQPEDFLAQSPSAFLEQPGFLETAQLAPPTPSVEESPEYLKIAVGIAAAVVVLRLMMRHEFSKEELLTDKEIAEAARRIYRKVSPAWLSAAVPAVAQAYKLGATGNLSYSELETLAVDYATELGQYVHDTSIDAVVEGFNAQVNAGWNERLAWQRSREAYGLDTSQMRSYVKGLMKRDKEEYITDPVPAAARSAIDRAFLYRADRLGSNEAYKATQVGKNLAWLAMESTGDLPDGTMKRWITADDERVCPVCGPLHMVAIPLHRRFESMGRFFYAPGVHPNCRCELDLVYPEFEDVVKSMPGDPYDRDAEGQFAATESRSRTAVTRVTPKVSRTNVRERTSAVDLSAVGALDLSSLATADLSSIADLTSQKAVSLTAVDLSTLTDEGTTTVVQHHRRPNAGRPQRHGTSAWLAVDVPLIEALGFESLGQLISYEGDLDFSDVGQGSEYGEHGVLGYSVPVDSGVDDNPAFNRAFNEFMSGEVGVEAIDRNRQAKAEDAKRVLHGVSDYGQIDAARDLDQDWLVDAAKAFSGKERGALISVARRTLTENTAQDYASEDLMDDDFMDTATASEIATEMVNSVENERHLGDPYRVGPWQQLAERMKSTADLSLDSVLMESQLMAAEGSSRGKITPVIFKTTDWYGKEMPGEPVPGDSYAPDDAELRGTYRITDVTRIGGDEIPPEVWSEEIADAVKEIIVIELELTGRPKG